MRIAHNKLNLVGQKFNRLLVYGIGPVKRYPDGTSHTTFLCKCDCGSVITVIGTSLKSGNTKSCGCLKRESTIKNNTTHGMTGNPDEDLIPF